MGQFSREGERQESPPAVLDLNDGNVFAETSSDRSFPRIVGRRDRSLSQSGKILKKRTRLSG
jgi:hypothetical protein